MPLPPKAIDVAFVDRADIKVGRMRHVTLVAAKGSPALPYSATPWHGAPGRDVCKLCRTADVPHDPALPKLQVGPPSLRHHLS